MDRPKALDIEEDYFAWDCPVHDTFKRYFVKGKGDEGYQIHLHSNGVCYITLAQSHPIMTEDYCIKSVEFTAQRLNNQVSGKRKRGSQSMRSNSQICSIYTECGKTFEVPAFVEGNLAELNRRLDTNPQLLKSQIEGYIAIFMTKKLKIPSSWVPEEDVTK